MDRVRQAEVDTLQQVTGGGSGVTGTGGQLMSGGRFVTSGGRRPRWRDPHRVAAMAFMAFGLVYMIVNATSLIDQREALGQPIEPWRAWLLEGTSFVSWLVLLPVILWGANRIGRLDRPLLLVAGHAAMCLAVSLAHTAIMIALRMVSFDLFGARYGASAPVIDLLIFELRKDLITYVSIVLVFHIARRLMAQPEAKIGSGALADELIEVRDGTKTIWLKPDEIDLVVAAGNYVELHGVFGTKLVRRTMAEIEDLTAPLGFVRVHRSRLVRKASISSIETRQSGDFEIVLRSGNSVGGSRRFRANLQ